MPFLTKTFFRIVYSIRYCVIGDIIAKRYSSFHFPLKTMVCRKGANTAFGHEEWILLSLHFLFSIMEMDFQNDILVHLNTLLVLVFLYERINYLVGTDSIHAAIFNGHILQSSEWQTNRCRPINNQKSYTQI